MRIFKNFILFAGIILFNCIVFCSCADRNAEEETPVPVKTTRPEALVPHLTKSYPSVIRATAEAHLSFRIPGPISEVLVREGDYVKEGQLLALLDQRDYKTQLKATEARYNGIKAEAERVIALYGKERVSESDYDKAVHGLKQIEAKYEAHRNQLQDTRLTAPFDGQIIVKYFDNHEVVDAGIPVLSLVDPLRYELVTHLPARDYLRKDDFVEFRVATSEQPDIKIPAKLRSIASQANLNGLYTARFELENTAEVTILPGMSAETEITYRQEADELFKLPSTAIFGKEQKSRVWLVNQDKSTVHSVPVEILSIESDGQALVKADIGPDDIIVSAGVHSLREGQKVKSVNIPGYLP